VRRSVNVDLKTRRSTPVGLPDCFYALARDVNITYRVRGRVCPSRGGPEPNVIVERRTP
jgi:hypothetical protein